MWWMFSHLLPTNPVPFLGDDVTDAKQEALRQALHFHQATQPMYHGAKGEKRPKAYTANEVVATARKFEMFLDPHSKGRK